MRTAVPDGNDEFDAFVHSAMISMEDIKSTAFPDDELKTYSGQFLLPGAQLLATHRRQSVGIQTVLHLVGSL